MQRIIAVILLFLFISMAVFVFASPPPLPLGYRLPIGCYNDQVPAYNAATDRWVCASSVTGTVEWGFIQGSLSSQTDLSDALGQKIPLIPSPIAGRIPTMNSFGYLNDGSLGYAVGVAALNLVQLDSNAKLPAVDGSQLINLSSLLLAYPPIGVPSSTGTSWGASYTVGVAAYNLVQLDANAKLPTSALDSDLNTIAGLTPSTGAILIGYDTDWTKSTATYPLSLAKYQLLYASSNDTISGLPSASNGLLVTDATGKPSIATDIPNAVTIGGVHVYSAAGEDVAIADGGTERSSWTQYGIVYAITNSGGLGEITIGSPGYLLAVNGSGNGYQWVDIPIMADPTMDTIPNGIIYEKVLASDIDTAGHVNVLWDMDGIGGIQIKGLTATRVVQFDDAPGSPGEIVAARNLPNVFTDSNTFYGDVTFGDGSYTHNYVVTENMFTGPSSGQISRGRIEMKYWEKAFITSDGSIADVLMPARGVLYTLRHVTYGGGIVTPLPPPEPGGHIKFIYDAYSSDTWKIMGDNIIFIDVNGVVQALEPGWYLNMGGNIWNRGQTLDCTAASVMPPVGVAWICRAMSDGWIIGVPH